MSNSSCFLSHPCVPFSCVRSSKEACSVVSAPVYSQWWAACPTALVIEAKRFIWSQALRSRSDGGPPELTRTGETLQRQSAAGRCLSSSILPPALPFFGSIALLHLLLWGGSLSISIASWVCVCVAGEGGYFLFLLFPLSVNPTNTHVHMPHTNPDSPLRVTGVSLRTPG